MDVALKKDYKKALDEQKKEVRELVMAGLEQIKEGKTKDFIPASKMICQQITANAKVEANHLANKYAREYNTVCDRLEKKYKDEAISN